MSNREPSEDSIRSRESSEDLFRRSDTVNERNDLSGQQSESVIRMEVPQSKKSDDVRLVQFNIPKLTKSNVRTWKSDVEEFCQIQGCWEIVGHTLARQDNPDALKALLEDENWAVQDAKARYYIKLNIQPEDKTSARDLKNSGAVWKYLMNRYERTTQYDTIVAFRKIAQWKKDSKMDVEASLQQLEQLNAELHEISDRKNRFDELTLLTIFLDGRI
jgi:Domain of unknown function (DUF4219)/gag-polypeptide of LTR copia-type